MSVLDRAALQASPLADLHAIASELSIDGYRRLRRKELVEAILGGQDAADVPPPEDEAATATPDKTGAGDRDGDPAAADEPAPAARKRRGRRGGRGRASAKTEGSVGEERAPADESASVEQPDEREPDAHGREEEVVDGVVELVANGSGFVRVAPPEPSDDDVYVAAAQVKRCELVTGDRVSGPRRAPRRSERFASLVRVDTVNGRPVSELADGTRFDDLPAVFADERFRLGSEDPTIKAIEWLTPFGRGSRVTIAGATRAGKTEALLRLAAALAPQENLRLSVALVGVRPEEISLWRGGPVEPACAISFAASADARGQALELVIDQARRIAARGADAVVLVDTLDDLHPQAARKALGAAKKIVDGGSLTVIATASVPVGGETTVIALDSVLASTARFPALDLAASGTIRPELLVGEAGAEAIARARAEVVDA
ncbi:MAG: transcription termination factor Rho [Solirubrobacterales bacterium]|nr:MAG: transcription termination factor Rho [Solirubrobacterales bacterium]